MSFIKPGKTSRAEVQARLGPADKYYEDLGIGCYRRNEVTYRECVFIFFIPTASGPVQDRSSDVAYIQYDAWECVRRFVEARAMPRSVSEWRERAEEIAGVKKAK